MQDPIIYVYIVLAFIFPINYVLKPEYKNKLLLYLISVWMLGGAFVNSDFVIINIPGLAFERQYNRIFLFILFAIFSNMILSNLQSKNKKTLLSSSVHIMFFVFVAWVVLATFVIRDTLNLRDFIVIIEGYILSFLLFITTSKIKNMEGIQLLGKIIILTSIISSIVSFIQFFVFESFLRVGVSREAFAGFIRPNGIFFAEYEHAYFLIFGIIWTYILVEKKIIKTLLYLVFASAILISFHRMSWITTVIVFFFIYILDKDTKLALPKMIIIAFIFGILLLILAQMFFGDNKFLLNSFISERLLGDTYSIRFNYYESILENVSKNLLWGVGNKFNSVYYSMMIKIADQDWALGLIGGLHNGFLSTLFYHGIVSLFLLIILFGTIIKKITLRFIKINKISILLLLSTVIFILANLTNDFPLKSFLGNLFAINIGLGIRSLELMSVKNVD